VKVKIRIVIEIPDATRLVQSGIASPVNVKVYRLGNLHARSTTPRPDTASEIR
jgi:hypothetical protein